MAYIPVISITSCRWKGASDIGETTEMRNAPHHLNIMIPDVSQRYWRLREQ